MYAGIEGFMSAALAFLRDGIAAAEPSMVAVDAQKIQLLTEALGPDASAVSFVEMRGLGRNPGRIIPAWRDFVAEHAGGGRRLRGIGEPVWPERSDAELAECECHESLLNLAFDDGPGWTLLCPYDTEALPATAVEVGRRTHPWIVENGTGRLNHAYVPPGLEMLDDDLPPVPPGADQMTFTGDELGAVRALVASRGARAGLDDRRVGELVLAVHELATNSMRHGGGHGILRVWQDDEAVICEVVDGGWIREPLVGRALPAIGQAGGHGLWLVNQTCDLVQLRSSAAGSVVRVHMLVA